jgi:hypothetical protein
LPFWVEWLVELDLPAGRQVKLIILVRLKLNQPPSAI